MKKKNRPYADGWICGGCQVLNKEGYFCLVCGAGRFKNTEKVLEKKLGWTLFNKK